MARDRVQIVGRCPASPEAVWALAGDFLGRWHPAVATMRAERDARGSLIRAFTVHGDDTVYRERLTWLSDSDRSLGYTHLEGIAGVTRYDAWMSVSADEGGLSRIEWTADLEADDAGRTAAIAAGTRAIFEAGVEALSARAGRSATSTAMKTIILDGAPRLALTVTGDSDGIACLFLHGIGGARWNWERQLTAAGSVMRAAALDLRGYGESALGPAPSTVEDHCGDILRVRETLGADTLVLVGLSYGSWIATSFAMRHPELLAGLVLSGGCTGMSEAGLKEREAFRVSRQAPLDAGQTPAELAPSVAKTLAGPGASDEVKARLIRSMADIPAVTYRDAVHCFANPAERFDFSRLTMPVLMMTGEQDRLASPAEIQGVARRILEQSPHPDVRYETIADSGHVCNIEQPLAYNRILVEFLERLRR